jgi:hypothetical protein
MFRLNQKQIGKQWKTWDMIQTKSKTNWKAIKNMKYDSNRIKNAIKYFFKNMICNSDWIKSKLKSIDKYEIRFKRIKNSKKDWKEPWKMGQIESKINVRTTKSMRYDSFASK